MRYRGAIVTVVVDVARIILISWDASPVHVQLRGILGYALGSSENHVPMLLLHSPSRLVHSTRKRKGIEGT